MGHLREVGKIVTKKKKKKRKEKRGGKKKRRKRENYVFPQSTFYLIMF
jgi:hypothetical protein